MAGSKKSLSQFVIFHRPGPKWKKGVEFNKQKDVRLHSQYYMRLHEQNKLDFGGPFLDGTGSMMIPAPEISQAEIEAFTKNDPAVIGGLLIVEIRPLKVSVKK